MYEHDELLVRIVSITITITLLVVIIFGLFFIGKYCVSKTVDSVKKIEAEKEKSIIYMLGEGWREIESEFNKGYSNK